MAMSGTRSSRLPAVAVIPRGYTRFLTEVKERIRRAQVRTVFAANRELIRLYWDIGRRVVERQEREGWGEAVIERLAADVQKGFPGIGGFSRSNLFYMRQFYLAYRERGRKVQQLVGQIPWGHNVTILSRVHDPQQREWYARQARSIRGSGPQAMDHRVHHPRCSAPAGGDGDERMATSESPDISTRKVRDLRSGPHGLCLSHASSSLPLVPDFPYILRLASSILPSGFLRRSSTSTSTCSSPSLNLVSVCWRSWRAWRFYLSS